MCLLLCYMQCVYVYLRQCVIEVFCSTSTDKSKKSSSLLLTCKNKGHVSSQSTYVLGKKRKHLFRNWDLATHRDNVSYQASSRGRVSGNSFLQRFLSRMSASLFYEWIQVNGLHSVDLIVSCCLAHIVERHKQGCVKAQVCDSVLALNCSLVAMC